MLQLLPVRFSSLKHRRQAARQLGRHPTICKANIGPAISCTSQVVRASNCGSWHEQVMQIYQLDAMDFRFLAHPSAFVMHRPHPPSSGYNHTFTGEAYTQKHKPTDHLWKMERIAKDMMAELRVGAHP